METTFKRPIRSKAEREAAATLSREFWSKKEEKPVSGHLVEWKDRRLEHDRKICVFKQAVRNGTINLDELLVRYDLVKFL